MRPICHPASVGALPELDIVGERFSGRVGMPAARLGLTLVIAGAERATRTGKDYYANGTVGVGLVEDAVQLGFELVRERVHPLGAIERNGRDALIDAVNDVLAHPSLLLASATVVVPGGRANNTLVRSEVNTIYPGPGISRGVEQQ